MQYTWILFSLAGLVALGLGDFIKKLILEKWANKEVFLFVCFCLYIPMFLANMILQWDREFSVELLKSGVMIGILNSAIPLWMLTALKYLNVSFALVSIRVFSSFCILFIGVLVLWDSLSLWNYIGFLLWAFAIFLLSWFSFSQKNTFPTKWIIALVITFIGIVISNSYFKYILPDINIHDFMAVQFTTTGIVLSVYMLLRKKFQYLSIPEVKKVFPYAIITSFIFLCHFLYFLPNIYLLWPLSLGYKMLSYSLIVPILLSIIFLWEPVNRTRIIAFGLTIISIFLFLV